MVSQAALDKKFNVMFFTNFMSVMIGKTCTIVVLTELNPFKSMPLSVTLILSQGHSDIKHLSTLKDVAYFRISSNPINLNSVATLKNTRNSEAAPPIRSRKTHLCIISQRVFVCVCVHARACVCVCARARARACVCVCVVAGSEGRKRRREFALDQNKPTNKQTNKTKTIE